MVLQAFLKSFVIFLNVIGNTAMKEKSFDGGKLSPYVINDVFRKYLYIR